MQEKTNSGVAIIITIVAILALIIAWSAFNRSGKDVSTTIENRADQAEIKLDSATNQAQQEANEATIATKRAAARVEARTELLTLKAKVEAKENYAEVATEVKKIDDKLASAYANASAEAKAEYAEVQVEMNKLETALRNGTGDVLELFGGLLLMLEADVRTDPDPQS